MKKVTVTEHREYPDVRTGSMFATIAAIFAAPFTGGLSLLAIPVIKLHAMDVQDSIDNDPDSDRVIKSYSMKIEDGDSTIYKDLPDPVSYLENIRPQLDSHQLMFGRITPPSFEDMEKLAERSRELRKYIIPRSELDDWDDDD